MSLRFRGRAAQLAAALMTIVCTCVAALSAQMDRAQANQEQPNQEAQQVDDATEILAQVLSAQGPTIPPAVLEKAAAIVVLPLGPPRRPQRGEGPATRRLRFMYAPRARGILSVRDEGARWSVPAFVTLYGGSQPVGDIILVLLTPKAVESALGNGLKLESGAAGPVSADSKISGEVPGNAEVLIYSRSRGDLTGIALEANTVQYDPVATKQFYGKALAPAEVVKQTVAPEPVPAWRAALEKYARK